MTQKLFEATIQVPGASPTKVQIQAPDAITARRLLEAQYGKDSLKTLPRQVKWGGRKMAFSFTVTCPHCGSTTTVKTGVSKSGAGVGSCQSCHKNVRVYVDGDGNVKKVTKPWGS